MESVSLSRILIVEDDLGVREALALALGLEGYAVLTATSAAEGLRQVSAQPDLILLDVLLPGSDGFSFLRELRERSSVPVNFRIRARRRPLGASRSSWTRRPTAAPGGS